jgi:BAH domain
VLRIMSPGAARKPKRRSTEEVTSNAKCPRTTEESSSETVISYEWLSDPVSIVDGREYYESIRISSNQKSFSVRKGGAIVLSTENDNVICRVDRFFVQAGDDDSPVKVEGRWFLRHKDLVARLGNAITPDSEEFVDRLEVQELVLTNLLEENDIAAIEGTCHIQYVKAGQDVPSSLPANTFLCRYKLDIDNVNKTLEWDSISSFEMDEPAEEANDYTVDETLSSASDDDSASASSVEEISKVVIQEGEGGALRGDILVGSKYQMKIGPFVPGLTVRSRGRGPKLVYKSGRISDDDLHVFLNKVADVHNCYLSRQGMTMEDPYTPLSQERAEEMMRKTPGNKPLTGSSMSTASMLAGNRSRLLKECSSDALLEILSDHDFDTNAALVTIKSNLGRITVGWTRPEKDIFDDGFRRHQAALRMIAKAIAPTKTMKDVIDYHYRFKIPDQFRKYQDKKREQAVRMVECIETRKHHESFASSQSATTASNHGHNENAGKPSHWSENPVSNIADEKDERVRTAKKLLLDVKDKYGKDTMAEVASVIRQLQRSYEPEAREELFKLLNDQPELRKRFLEFLPKHF